MADTGGVLASLTVLAFSLDMTILVDYYLFMMQATLRQILMKTPNPDEPESTRFISRPATKKEYLPQAIEQL